MIILRSLKGHGYIVKSTLYYKSNEESKKLFWYIPYAINCPLTFTYVVVIFLGDAIIFVNRKNIKYLFFQMDISHITFWDETVNMQLNELWLSFVSAGRRYAVERR